MAVFILDTSAILSGKDISLGNDKLYTTPGIAGEIEHGRMRRKLDFLLDAGLGITTPSPEAVKTIREKAKLTGDIARVSEQDIEVLALGLEMDACVLTDDYSIQNLAKALGVSFKGISMPEIKEEIHWKYRCKSCGKYLDEFRSDCLICGGPVRTVRR